MCVLELQMVTIVDLSFSGRFLGLKAGMIKGGGEKVESFIFLDGRLRSIGDIISELHRRIDQASTYLHMYSRAALKQSKRHRGY